MPRFRTYLPYVNSNYGKLKPGCPLVILWLYCDPQVGKWLGQALRGFGVGRAVSRFNRSFYSSAHNCLDVRRHNQDLHSFRRPRRTFALCHVV